MNNVELKPKIIFDIFAEINQVPRPSGHEEKMGAYLKDFAEKHGLGFKMDAAGNVLISAPATPGYENKKPVIIQAHQDMVPEKNPDVEIYAGVVDEGLNEDKYIVPGVGDAGDRIFGTK